ncbi:hypothetical protein BO94DRAFT_12255 [Aspergillus sclerotioniger CBS 115572]|uniref:Uncharacterized protein n=1 Tax=Aspergillus sclerotioniger CBS 115572 TaxID=1450535 RepID=A0A317XD54_9EURO|nr:hypothetical protein BO94DRAFT_12255 [Aspergillus sclerotioniger CBS 115572]PWY96463.1 hypothetical protein BO94DRAFT_12255 [Aspergillus sclerotioniger CBS 115572]
MCMGNQITNQPAYNIPFSTNTISDYDRMNLLSSTDHPVTYLPNPLSTQYLRTTTPIVPREESHTSPSYLPIGPLTPINQSNMFASPFFPNDRAFSPFVN